MDTKLEDVIEFLDEVLDTQKWNDDLINREIYDFATFLREKIGY